MDNTLSVRALCPRCHCAAVRPSRPQGLERLLALVLVRPYRCRRCTARFMRFWFWSRPTARRTGPAVRIEHLLRTPIA